MNSPKCKPIFEETIISERSKRPISLFLFAIGFRSWPELASIPRKQRARLPAFIDMCELTRSVVCLENTPRTHATSLSDLRLNVIDESVCSIRQPHHGCFHEYLRVRVKDACTRLGDRAWAMLMRLHSAWDAAASVLMVMATRRRRMKGGDRYSDRIIDPRWRWSGTAADSGRKTAEIISNCCAGTVPRVTHQTPFKSLFLWPLRSCATVHAGITKDSDFIELSRALLWIGSRFPVRGLVCCCLLNPACCFDAALRSMKQVRYDCSLVGCISAELDPKLPLWPSGTCNNWLQRKCSVDVYNPCFHYDCPHPTPRACSVAVCLHVSVRAFVCSIVLWYLLLFVKGSELLLISSRICPWRRFSFVDSWWSLSSTVKGTVQHYWVSPGYRYRKLVCINCLFSRCFIHH